MSIFKRGINGVVLYPKWIAFIFGGYFRNKNGGVWGVPNCVSRFVKDWRVTR